LINCFRKAKFCLNEGPEDDSPEEDQLERFDDDDLPTCAEKQRKITDFLKKN